MAALTHPPARVVAQLLVDLGVASAVGGDSRWAAYVNSEPASPDEVLTVYDSDGPTFGVLQTSGEVTGYAGVQVRVRAGDYAAGYARAAGLADALGRVAGAAVAVDDARYRVGGVGGLDNVNRLGTDKPSSARHLFTVNGTVDLTEL